MIMLGLYETDEIPFEDVYLHGLIQDEQGQKMSKSKGNVVNPIEKVEEYGSDAFRMGIISDESAGNNRPYDETKLVGARNFANKLWNIARYVEDVVGDKPDRADPGPSSTADHWVLSKLQQSQEKIWSNLDTYRFGEAYNTLYHFVWNDLADWYVEASKSTPNKPLLAYLLEQTLILAHPFAPFVTETIWQTLDWENDSVLATRTLDKIIKSSADEASKFNEIQTIVTEVRFITKALNVSGRSLYHTGDDFLEDNTLLIKQLARLKSVGQGKGDTGLYLTATRHDCWLNIDKEDAKAYAEKLAGKQSRQAAVVKQLEARLKNKSYVDNAPRAVVSQTKQQLEAAEELLASIEAEKKRFEA
jgi:valyl-tRNA synthetase